MNQKPRRCVNQPQQEIITVQNFCFKWGQTNNYPIATGYDNMCSWQENHNLARENKVHKNLEKDKLSVLKKKSLKKNLFLSHQST